MRARSATLCGCAAILLWASLALLSRAAEGVPALQLTAVSFGVSGVLGLAWLAWRGALRELRQPGLAWVHGVGGLFGYHACYFAGLALAPAAAANLINYLWPLLIVLLSGALLGMRLGWRHWAGAALGLAGCGALLASGAAFPAGAWRGYAFAGGAAVIWALYSVLSRRLTGVPTGAVAGFCAATAVLAGLAQAAAGGFVAMSPGAWTAAVAMGVGPVGAAFALWDVGMKRGDPRLLGTLAFATPVLSTLLLAAGGEAVLDARTAVAAGLVAAGGVLAARG